MIFVTVGTNEAPFDRLLHALTYVPGDEEIVVQHGFSRVRPAQATCFQFLPFEALVEYVRRSRVVVTHAGVGSVMVALANGKPPIVLPRLKRFGEAVDDHQVPFAWRMAEHGLVTVLEDATRLPDVLAEPPSPGRAGSQDGSRLADDLRTYLENAVAKER
jgi:UDP-N-acetylglucosamine transferase subunit ALG13